MYHTYLGGGKGFRVIGGKEMPNSSINCINIKNLARLSSTVNIGETKQNYEELEIS